MVQHAISIVLGLAVIIISFIGSLSGNVHGLFPWLYIGAAVLLLGNACWGFMDDMEHTIPPPDEGGM